MLNHLTRLVELNHSNSGFAMHVTGRNPFGTMAVMSGLDGYILVKVDQETPLDLIEQSLMPDPYVAILDVRGTLDRDKTEAITNILMAPMQTSKYIIMDDGSFCWPVRLVHGMITYPLDVMEEYDELYQAYKSQQEQAEEKPKPRRNRRSKLERAAS